jgi:hypothetical protein
MGIIIESDPKVSVTQSNIKLKIDLNIFISFQAMILVLKDYQT